MNDTIRLVLILLGVAFIGWPLLWLAVTTFSGVGLENKTDDWPKPTYTSGIEKVNKTTANVTVNGRTFTVAQNRSGIHVQETTGGRFSSWVTISDNAARFGNTKAQAAAKYIKTIVDEGHPIP